jgi:methionine sulfoxide reductase heme-binding subunit
MDQALWFASRGTGLVSLILLSATLVLGTVHSGRSSTQRWPRFTVHAVHRNLSTLSLVFLAVHISTAVIDPYVDITWLDVVVPFVSGWKPFYLGLGTIAFDLLIAVVITSALRTRIPLRLWQWVHWAAYAMWPIALVHGLGAGGKDSDLLWVQALNVICAAAVILAVGRRIVGRFTTDAPVENLPRQRSASGSHTRAGAR